MISIYDITGKQILEVMVEDDAIDLSILHSGNYFLITGGHCLRFNKR
jgi:hypothetical protein